jgi:uncharacterized SAM-binding protein YcdF (DUF218 family)
VRVGSRGGRFRRLQVDRPLLRGVLLGVLLVFVLRTVINETGVADRLVSPLVLADTRGPADVIVVPGAGVTELCTPNFSALRRVLLAARLLGEGRAGRILIAGGRPAGMDCTIAEVMADFAVRIGVPRERLIVETTSMSTWENAVRSLPILRQMGARRVLVVTDRLHVPRAQASFERLGLIVERAGVPVHEGHADNVSMLYWGLREYAALAYYRLVVFPRAGQGE